LYATGSREARLQDRALGGNASAKLFTEQQAFAVGVLVDAAKKVGSLHER
jgi:hypothetical protein